MAKKVAPAAYLLLKFCQVQNIAPRFTISYSFRTEQTNTSWLCRDIFFLFIMKIYVKNSCWKETSTLEP